MERYEPLLDQEHDTRPLLDDETILNAALEAMSLGGETEFGLPPPDTFELKDADVADALKSVMEPLQFGATPPSEDVEAEPSIPHTPVRNKIQEEPVTPVEKITKSLDFELPDDNENDELHGFYKEFSDKLGIKEDETRASSASKTLILLSPLSYKHVFSRWWINRRYLSSIVERPQRLMACSVGIGAAVTKFPRDFQVQVSTKKVSLNVEHVTNVHGSNWSKQIYELCEQSKAKLEKREVEVPEHWNYGDIYLTKGTVDALEGVVGSVETAVDGLFKGEAGNQVDRAFVTIRPPGHHSHPCVPSGFCLINNVHIAVEYAKKQYGVTHAVILDFDLHHGDGTQDICWAMAGYEEQFGAEEDDNNEKEPNNGTATGEAQSKKSAYAPAPDPDTETPKTPTGSHEADGKENPKKKEETPDLEPQLPRDIGIGYFSLHDISSFPTEFGYTTAENIKNGSVCLMSHNMCIWNVHLEPYETEQEFYETYEASYSILFYKARKYLKKCKQEAEQSGKPFKSLVLFSAGFDASEYEGQGMQRHAVNVPTSFYNRFTRDGLRLANEYSDGKVLSLLEGGYSDKALSTGLFSHMSGLSGHQWDAQWINQSVAKEFERGCKLRWTGCSTVFKKDHAQDTDWIESGIKLGRSLWPEEVRMQAAGMGLGAATTGKVSRTGLMANNDSLATPSRMLRDRTKIQTPFRGAGY